MENTFWNTTEVSINVKQLKIIYIGGKMLDVSHDACENPVHYAPFPLHFLHEHICLAFAVPQGLQLWLYLI